MTGREYGPEPLGGFGPCERLEKSEGLRGAALVVLAHRPVQACLVCETETGQQGKQLFGSYFVLGLLGTVAPVLALRVVPDRSFRRALSSLLFAHDTGSAMRS